MNRGVLIFISAFVVINLAFSVVAFEWNPVNWFKGTTTGNAISISVPCEAYSYNDCPIGCVKKCVPSFCSGGKCTNDCGPKSCTSKDKPVKKTKDSGKKAKDSGKREKYK